MAKESKEQTSNDEKKILKELQKNSRKNIDVIARHCGVSKQKVSRIINQLEKDKMIWGYTTITDQDRQGLQKFILLLKRSMKSLEPEISEEESMDRFLNDYPEMGITIESSYYIHGDYDWMLIFTAADLKHAKKFCSLLTTKYPGVILRFYLMQILYSPRSHYIMNPQLKKLEDIP